MQAAEAADDKDGEEAEDEMDADENEPPKKSGNPWDGSDRDYKYVTNNATQSARNTRRNRTFHVNALPALWSCLLCTVAHLVSSVNAQV